MFVLHVPFFFFFFFLLLLLSVFFIIALTIHMSNIICALVTAAVPAEAQTVATVMLAVCSDGGNDDKYCSKSILASQVDSKWLNLRNIVRLEMNFCLF